MLSNWPIRRKLLFGLSLLLVMVASLVWSGLHGLYAYRSVVRSLERRLAELPSATQLSMRVSNLRVVVSEMRTWGALRDASPAEGSPPAGIYMIREEFRENLKQVKETLQEYRHQLLHTRWSGTRIGNSEREWEAVHKIEASLASIEKANRDEDWLLDAVRVGELAADLETLQSLAGALPKYLHQDIEQFTIEVRGQYRALISLAWVTSISTCVMLGMFVILFYRWIFRPLRVLIDGSRSIANDHFNYRIHVDTRDEMAELAGAMNDMTDRFESIRDDLDRQVRERTRQVVRSEQLASVGFLAAGVAHEINNPLASIALCAESLESRVSEVLHDDDERHGVIRSYLRMIQDEAFRCKGITERLLDFSRLGDVKRQNTELRELVQGVIDMVGHLGKYHEKHIVFEQGEPVVAPVNPQEIKQVVLNLLTNALDSLDPGGVVTVRLRQTKGLAELVFTDNGCGMTAEVLQHLFEPFFTRRRGGQGTGLGLSITFRIVADHEGNIEAASEGPGRGAQFRVVLPLAANETVKEISHHYQAA